MAERTGLSKTTIGEIWKKVEFKPPRVDVSKLSNDPLFIAKLYDVVGLYMNPPEAAIVLCVDEKAPVQALQRSQPALPTIPGCPSAELMTTFVTAPRRCSSRSTAPTLRGLQPAPPPPSE